MDVKLPGVTLPALFKAKKFVLSIGDEAAVLSLFSGDRLVNAWVAEPDPADGAADIVAALATAKTVPVFVLIDAFEQIFREEKVPRVSFLDQKKVIDRHLQVAFPGKNLQAAVSHGADPQGNRFFLFCSVPPTEQVRGWLKALEDAKRAPRGVHMLPLESLDMLDRLTPAAAQKGVRWRILFTFNMTGGLRQIVSKQGRIMVTRLTPPPPPDSAIDPVQIVERDFQQTLAYVKRMGYQKGDNLDVVVLAEEPVASAIRERGWEAHSVTVISPHEVGTRLGLGPVGQPGQPYADVVHALWFATRRKPKARLSWAQSSKVDYVQMLSRGAPVAAVVAVLALVGQGASMAWTWMDTQDMIEIQRRQLRMAETALAREQARLAELDYRAEDIRPLIDAVDRITDKAIAPVPLLARLGHALAGNAVLTELALTTPRDDTGGNSRRQAQQDQNIAWRLGMTVSLPAETAGDADALARADALKASLEALFPGHRVEVLQPPVAVGEDQVVRGGAAMAGVGVGVDAAAGGAGDTDRRDGYTVSYEVVREAAS